MMVSANDRLDDVLGKLKSLGDPRAVAALAIHDKKVPDERFEAFLPFIVKHATDERNFVKKAVNWALRQIGKRDRRLNSLAIQTAERIRQIDSHAARWIASDALRELTSDPVRARLARRT